MQIKIAEVEEEAEPTKEAEQEKPAKKGAIKNLTQKEEDELKQKIAELKEKKKDPNHDDQRDDEYIRWAEEKIKKDAPLKEPQLHPHCKCDIDNDLWVISNEACEDCREAQKAFNRLRAENKMDEAFDYFKKHKGIE